MPRNENPTTQDERLELLTARLTEQNRVRIDELSVEFSVSEMTIRRDLDELQGRGLARRVRGGAVAVGAETFAARHRHNARAKGRIAEKLATLLPDTGTVAFDASSTVHRLASQLDGARDLMVLTNGLDTFQVLHDKPGVSVALTGGEREPRTGSLVGPMATRASGDLLFDVFMCSAAGIDAELGASEASIAEAEVKRALASASTRVVLALDSSKLDSRASGRAFRTDQIHTLVTELAPSDRRLAAYRDHYQLL